MEENVMEEQQESKCQMDENISKKIDIALNSTAESLDRTAQKMHEAANFLKDKNSSTLKEDVSKLAKKHPIHAIAGGLFIGFLVGKLLKLG